MHRGKKTKERAQANKEAAELAKAKAEQLAKEQQAAAPQQPAEEPVLGETPDDENEFIGSEPEPSDEHRQPLEIWHPLQESPGVNAEGKPINKMGRKGLYRDEICLVVEKLASEGFTDREICGKIGLGLKTFYEWKHKYPHFSQAINKFRGLADMFVENALFRAALGYDYTEQQAVRGEFAVEVVDVKKHMTGSVAAQKFYLTNRMANRYKNKVEATLALAPDISTMAIAIKRRED